MHQVMLETNILEQNETFAEHNQAHFRAHGVFVINFMSAPGAGKTSVLEQTIQLIKAEFKLGVIEGDLMTTLDADRIAALGVPAYQITTGTVCHLDAQMVQRALHNFPLDGLDLLLIENVGNMVCPAEFNLGEDLRVMVYSTVEGAEKPKKYPLMFHQADAVLLNKIDLLPYAGVSLAELERNVLEVSPETNIFPLSCRTGEGIEAWVDWLKQRNAEFRQTPAANAAAVH
ncbi:MAG: hydrogenase nickel incorporation protein HypB [Acidobacteria bacterium]|nr:hydrogenase nickel incorporation protein HypB [Acidobacteriota bacterium]MBI3427192.1 hydrogenase nickel incorporation protein HypB [Acidobacteriota bacterium]